MRDEPPYTWTVRLWKARPQRLVAIFASCLGAAFIGWLLLHQILAAIIGFFVIAFATAEYWMPQKYKLAKSGASARCGLSVTAIAWEDIKRVIPDAKGVKLSPLAEDTRMAPFRGVYLRFEENEQEVMSRIRAKLNDDV